MPFKVGDRVQCIEGTILGSIGTVVAVMLNANGFAQFNLYDVRFDFGMRTVCGIDLALQAENKR